MQAADHQQPGAFVDARGELLQEFRAEDLRGNIANQVHVVPPALEHVRVDVVEFALPAPADRLPVELNLIGGVEQTQPFLFTITGVETGDVGDGWKHAPDHLEPDEGGGVVQGSQIGQRSQPGEHVVGDQDALPEFTAAEDHAVARRADLRRVVQERAQVCRVRSAGRSRVVA